MRTDAEKLSPVAIFTGLYFALMATDCFSVAGIGSLLRIIAVIPLVLLVFEYKSLKIRINPAIALQLLFLIAAIVSVLYTADMALTKKGVVTLFLNLTLVLCLGSMKSYSEKEVRFLEKSLLIGSWLTAVLMLIFSGISDGRLTLKMGEYAQDANYINGYLLFAFAYHLDKFLKNGRIWHLAGVAFLLTLVLMTGSRGALLAFGLLALVRLWAYIRNNRGNLKKWLYLLVVLVFAVILLDAALMILPDEVSSRFDWGYMTSAKGTTGRIGTWKNLLQHYSNDDMGHILFGHGYGSTRAINTYNGNVAHNLYIDNLISLGMSGCILQILIQFSYGVMLNRRKDKYYIYVLAGLIGMCMSLSLTSYRPMWNLMLIALILHNSAEVQNTDRS